MSEAHPGATAGAFAAYDPAVASLVRATCYRLSLHFFPYAAMKAFTAIPTTYSIRSSGGGGAELNSRGLRLAVFGVS